MAITINKFEVSTDRLSIDVIITVGSGDFVADIKFWDETTYKIASQAVDLNAKIAGTSEVETFTISNTEAGVTKFDGIYFLEIASDNVADVDGLVATTSLTRYYYTMSKLLANIDLSCLNCNANFQNALLLDLYIEGIKNSILLGRFRDAIELQTKINIYTENECPECSEINPVVSTAGNVVSIGVIGCQLSLT